MTTRELTASQTPRPKVLCALAAGLLFANPSLGGSDDSEFDACPSQVLELWPWVAEQENPEAAIAACWQHGPRTGSPQKETHFVFGDLAQAVLFLQRGQPGAAFDEAQSALDQLSISGEEPLTEAALQLRGDALYYLKRPSAAARDYERALQLAASREAQDREWMASLHKDLGIALRDIGAFEESLQHLDKAKEMAAELYLFATSGSVLGNLGSVYRRLGSNRLAATSFLELQRLADAIGDGPLALDAAARLGELYLDAGSADRAVEILEGAQEVMASSTSQESIWFLEILADARLAAGDAAGACEIFARTVRRHRQGAPAFRLVASLVGLGACLEFLDPAAAEAVYSEARQIAVTSDEGRDSWAAWAGSGRLALAEGELDRASNAFERALSLAREEATESAGPTDRRRFRQWIRPVYDAWIEILWRRSAPGDLERAFRLSEQAKLGERAERWWRSRQGETAIDSKVVALELEMARLSSQVLEGRASPNAESELQRLEVELRAREDKIWQRQLSLQPPPLEALRQRLPSGARLLSFHVTKTATFIFDLSAERRGFFKAEITHDELEIAIQNLLDLVQRDDELWRPAARRLMERLIEPWWLEGPEKRLLVAAEGPLAAWPMALSPPPGVESQEAARRQEIWLQRVAIEHILSATTADKEWSEPNPTPSEPDPLLLISQPMTDLASSPARRRSISLYDRALSLAPLPSSRREVEAARRFSHQEPTVLIGAEATEERVRDALSRRYEVVHFAAHAIWSVENPARSALVLAPSPGQDGLLQAGEILRLSAQAELVILSACQTARSTDGAPMQHLADAFFIAGAKSVLGTLWPVDDSKTAEFMAELYDRLANGATPSEALRSTQLALSENMAAKDFAAFILIGDGSSPLRLKPRATNSIESTLAPAIGFALAVIMALVLLGAHLKTARGTGARVDSRPLDSPHQEPTRSAKAVSKVGKSKTNPSSRNRRETQNRP